MAEALEEGGAGERSRLERELAAMSADVTRLRLRLEELEDQHAFDERKAAALSAERRGLHQARQDLERRLAAQGEEQAAEVAGLAEEHAAEVAGLAEEHAAEVAGLVEARAAEVAGLVEERDRAVADLGRLRAELRDLEAEGERLRDEVARLERGGAEAMAERDELRSTIDSLRTEIDTLRAHAEELRSMVNAEREAAADVTGELEEQRREHRALVTDLVRTQGTLQARSDQLRSTLTSRWYRLARSAWHARRRRPPLGALALAALALAGVVASVLLAGNAGALIAGLLGAGIVLALAGAYAVVVPALRDHREPRLAGEESYAQPLSGPAVEVPEPEPAAVAPPRPAPPAPAPRAVTRLVPAPAGGTEVDAERTRWLAAARAPGVRGLRVAGILDEMSRACFAPECRLDTGFGLEDWRERLEAAPPHLLLVESAWAGNGGGWQYGVASYTHPRYAGLTFLRELLAWCRERGIPTVFWNKEDPVHFERFKEAAALFDHVFTTDADRVGAYHALGGEHTKTVEALPFAAQPRLHNPVVVQEPRRSEPVFAGTYYRNRHAGRRSSLELVLDAARPHGLVIYDRRHGTPGDEYGFPERFAPHIRGRLSYADMVDVYKRHKVFINVNSVSESPTMFSRRVFELLACGTAVLSTHSRGMEEMFGDLVPVAEDQESAAAHLERLLGDEEYYSDLTLRGRRLVLAEHTYRQRLARIVGVAGFDLPPGDDEVAALLLADDVAGLEPLVDGLAAQTAAPAEVLVGLTDGTGADRALDRLAGTLGTDRLRTVVQDAASDPGARRRELAALATAPWVAPLLEGTAYPDDHLARLAACAPYAEADAIGPAPASGAGAQRYADHVDARRALASRELVAARGWPEDEATLRAWFAQGVRYFTADPEAVPARRR